MKRLFIAIIATVLAAPSYAQEPRDSQSPRALAGTTERTSEPSADEVEGAADVLPMQVCFDLVRNEKYEEAIPPLLKWKERLEDADSTHLLQYYLIIDGLGTSYSGLGKIDVSFNLYISVLEKEKARGNLENPLLRLVYTDMAATYSELKNYTQAIVYSIKSKKLYEQVHDYGWGYIRNLANLAGFYSHLGWKFYAKMCIDEAAAMCEGAIGKFPISQVDRLNILNVQATINQSIGHLDEAIAGFKKIVDDSASQSISFSTYQFAVNNLATCYMLKEKYGEAVRYYSLLHSDNSEKESLFLENTIMAACLANQEDRCLESLNRFNSLARENCAKVFDNFSEREREAYWTAISWDVAGHNNLVAGKMPSAIPLAYDNTIFTKSMLLGANNALKEAVESSNRPELQAEYLALQAMKDSLMYETMTPDQRETCRQEVGKRERRLIQTTPEFTDKIFSKFCTWRDVQSSLDSQDAAVEFITLTLMRMESLKNSRTWYAALVVRKDYDAPKLVRLCPFHTLEAKLKATDTGIHSISALYKETGDSSLYNLVWKELDKELAGAKNVFFSPTGDLNSISFNALRDNDEKILSERYNLYRLSSTAKIEEVKRQGSRLYSSAAIYGGILYNESVEDMANEAKPYQFAPPENDVMLAQRSEDERGGWKMLNGTITESTEIHEMLRANNVSSELYQFAKANEESVKALNHKSPDVLHIATHGFFIEDKEDVDRNPFLSRLGGYSNKENRLLYTGLLMAGANNAWRGKKVTDSEDGILTADEISRLDFSNTKLVVLSACQTGKGHIDLVDGVFGLQRAFKKAGAATIVMSLWKVPDEATSLLMKNFYERLLAGADSRTALHDAAKIVRQRYPDPYYWAAFVILD